MKLEQKTVDQMKFNKNYDKQIVGGVVQEFNVANYTATVRLAEGYGTLDGIPVAKNIDDSLVIEGVRCIVSIVNKNNPASMVLIAVY
jgi:hypothetical protein